MRSYFEKQPRAAVLHDFRRGSGSKLQAGGLTLNFELLTLKYLFQRRRHGHLAQGNAAVIGRRLAVEHVLGMLAAGDTPEVLLRGYPWLEADDIRACLAYARRVVGRERVEPLLLETSA